MEAQTLEIVYTWLNGREEVRYRRPRGSDDAATFISECEELQRKARERGETSPYSYRFV